MFGEFNYFPILNVRPSEMTALEHSPGPVKDRFLPIIGIKKWAGSHKLKNTLERLAKDYGDRHLIADIGPLGNGTGADVEVAELLKQDDGFAKWVEFIDSNAKYIPTIQNIGTEANVLKQAQALLALGRGLVVRLRRGQSWNAAAVRALSKLAPSDADVLLILDAGQLLNNEDVTLVASEIDQIAKGALAALPFKNTRVCVAASSFPSDFKSLHETRYRIEIRERALHEILNKPRAPFLYGDHASVFVAEREMARTGPPRIDYPSQKHWVYARRTHAEGFPKAAVGILAEADWDKNLTAWGAEKIKLAATGNITNMHYQRAWTAVRINLHLHQQAHFGSKISTIDTDEPWKD